MREEEDVEMNSMKGNKITRREFISRVIIAGLIIGGLGGGVFLAYPPRIKRYEINKDREEGKVKVRVEVESFLENDEVYAMINNSKIFGKRLEKNLYEIDIPLGENPTSLPLQVVAENFLRISSSIKEKIDWNVEDAFTYFSVRRGYGSELSKEFYQKYSDFVISLYIDRKDLLISALELYRINSSAFDRIYKFTKEHSQIDPKFKPLIISKASQLVSEIGYEKENLRDSSIKALINLAAAYELLKLPKELESAKLLIKGTRIEKYGDYLMDFDPIIIKDVTNRKIIIQSQNIPRDVWILARFLSYRPEIISEPKKFEWINRMIQQVAWDIFDSPYGPNSQWVEPTSGKTHSPENLTPTSEKVWQVILGFYDYMNSLPSKLEKDGIGIIFPFHDSDELQKYIADKTNRTIALFYLAALPSITLDKMNFKAKWDEAWNMYYQRLIDKNTLGKLLDNALKESIIMGIDAMKKFIEQLPSEYEEIVSKYYSSELVPLYLPPDGNSWVYGTWKDRALMWYANWLGDRGNHGLANTVSQFIGIDYPTAREMMDKFEQIIEDTNINGITQFLKKVWKYWDLVKFIYGYERGRARDWGGEWEMYRFGLPIAFKAFGIPHGARPYGLGEGLMIPPNRDLIYAGAPSVEWSVSLPDRVVDSLKQNFSNSNIVIGYGNYFGLYSCKDGLERDGATGIYQAIRNMDVYFWKK